MNSIIFTCFYDIYRVNLRSTLTGGVTLWFDSAVQGASDGAFFQLRGAAMLNIKVNFTIDVKKIAVAIFTAAVFSSQLMTPAHALPIIPSVPVKAHSVSVKEKHVTVALEYLNVTTTKSEAKKAITSPLAKYFDPQTTAFFMVYASGASMDEWKCANTLWSEESHFNPKALNMGSHALGIAQFMPQTWKNYKVKPTTSALLQIKYGMRYVKVRYGTFCNALDFHRLHNWY